MDKCTELEAGVTVKDLTVTGPIGDIPIIGANACVRDQWRS